MGRGQHDLLFNPPRIRLEKITAPGAISVIGPGKVPGRARLLLPDDQGGISLQTTRDNKRLVPVPFLGLDLKAQQKISDHILNGGLPIDKKAPLYSLTPEGFLWLRDETLLFLPREEMTLAAEPDLYPLSIDGDIFALHAGKECLFYLWQENGTNEIYLSSVSRQSGPGALQGYDFYSEAERLLVEEKGEKSIVFFAGIPGEDEASLLTIHPDGPGGRHPLDEHANHALWQGGENLISPAAEDGTYFYFDGDEGSLCFLDLKKRSNDIVSHDVDLDEDGQIDKIRDLAGSGDKVLLLKKGKLSLYSRAGLIDEVALTQDYSKISFTQDTALLWNEGQGGYLQVGIS